MRAAANEHLEHRCFGQPAFIRRYSIWQGWHRRFEHRHGNRFSSPSSVSSPRRSCETRRNRRASAISEKAEAAMTTTANGNALFDPVETRRTLGALLFEGQVTEL